jgi:hypothetical protein
MPPNRLPGPTACKKSHDRDQCRADGQQGRAGRRGRKLAMAHVVPKCRALILGDRTELLEVVQRHVEPLLQDLRGEGRVQQRIDRWPGEEALDGEPELGRVLERGHGVIPFGG